MMTRYQEFSILLRKLQSPNRYIQSAAIKDLTAAIQEANRSDLQKILELLISTRDVELQVKLFSMLAAYVINDGVHCEMIIKYNPLYETVQNLLVQGLPMKAASVLNFVMALLSCDDGDARSLATHARNMIRVSGCLNIMSNMFSGSMMYQDTWIALCQSLAEACRGSEVNQNYCSHIVPLSVQRCRQGNVDQCAVLQSLVHNHERNLQLFIKSDGLGIFTRQLLQNNMGMQLLNTIVEKSPAAVAMLRTTEVVCHLRDFLHLYGPYSQMGQWSTLILYHLDKEETSTLESTRRPVAADKITAENDIGLELRPKISKEKITMNYFQQNEENNIDYKNSKTEQVNGNTNYETYQQPKQDDTASLFQNVIKEIVYWKSKENNNFIKKITPDPFGKKEQRSVIESQNCYKNITKQNRIRKGEYQEDLSFSFLMKESFQHSKKQYSMSHNDKIIDSILTLNETTTLIGNNNMPSYDKGVQTNNTDHYNTEIYNVTNMDLKNFTPAFVSTPKHIRPNKRNISRIPQRSRTSTIYNKKRVTSTSKLNEHIQHHSKRMKQSNASKEARHRSMSERFFNAINESCTTIVKGMKNIFRLKQNVSEKSSRPEENEVENTTCGYSFTNYMRKRDALLEDKFSQSDDSNSEIYKVNSCKTCKDTIVLQQKMDRDEHLKHTVRKLKMGINLYGCDFKKISHAMWPRNRYMTPDMLCNLYRKLIVKGGHRNHEFRRKASNVIRKKSKY